MPLINTREEIKKHNSAVGSNIDLVNVQSYLDDAINAHIIPAIGYDQFSELLAVKYNDPSEKELRAIDLLQKAAVGFMVYNWADQGAVQFTNAGISVAKGANSLPASDKKIIALKKQNIATAYYALELAVSFLFENAVDFPIYAASEERGLNAALLINTSVEFQRAGVHINNDARFYQVLRITQATVEETYLEPTLGEIKQALHQGILSSSLSDIQKTLLAKVRKAIAAFTMAEAIPYGAIQMDATGIFESNESIGGVSGNVENRNPASDRRIAAAMNSFLTNAELQMEGIRKFLAVHKDEFFYVVPEEVNINTPGSNVFFI